MVVNHKEGDIVEWFNKKIYKELEDFTKDFMMHYDVSMNVNTRISNFSASFISLKALRYPSG